jgi:DNA-directed RNA polymerase II subunit RPB1
MSNLVQDAKILGIQFSILSPEEIRKSSVAKITNRDTYINNKPVPNGLFDSRMGTIEPGPICPTDGLDHIQCPGYFGHIELARPVFFIQYLDTVISVIKMICIRCSKILLDKHKYQYLLSFPNEKRWKKVQDLCSGIKRCGENDHGCGCIQPIKYKREGIATVVAEWAKMKNVEDDTVNNMKIPPEMFIKLFSKISDEDISFMGLSPIWSHPASMICSVLPVPPPAVRPSVKQDSSQRSEDDLSHLLVQIVKTNKALQEKMEIKNVSVGQLDDYHTLLQYYIASMVDNKIPNAKPAQQRSGRAFKSIKDRLNGKTGRLRGNLMGKRVDFSARSVITPDPNLSIRELGVPLKIAKNMTKPVVVNERNIHALTELVLNGPDIYPGAKLIEKKNAIFKSLKYANRSLIKLEIGDIVHRHMMDGDVILFNRQPTLHRMSMMGHKVRIMYKGDTFRMNVGDTKPYNADFDGDEMNLHMPQSLETETELRHLAAVPYQIVSPASSSPIIGIFQDSLVGAYVFSQEEIQFSPLQAMKLLNKCNHIDTSIFTAKKITNYDILSMIIPAMTIASDGVVIKNGKYVKGQLKKGVLGGNSNGLIHRIYNDFGHIQTCDFIDNLQYIVNEYMKTHSFSVGISDLYLPNKDGHSLKQDIKQKIYDHYIKVSELIQSVHLNEFKNDTGKTNLEEFEFQVNSILGKANQESTKIGIDALDKSNRFKGMVDSGSKGSDVNIAQMVACLGPQQIDGKRIDYGFDDRTLPHFTKYDDRPESRGFVASSFIEGLTPIEFFFHAMGGRIGLIDTAVKTSTTGYIQRRLIKALEDCITGYDGTVRNSKNKIMQFKYGDDNIDPCKVETQSIQLCSMKQEQIYAHFHSNFEEFAGIFDKDTFQRYQEQKLECTAHSKKVIEYMITMRDKIIKNVFNYTSEKSYKILIPVNFAHIIQNIKNQANASKDSTIDITPHEIYQLTNSYLKKLRALGSYAPTVLFELLFDFNLSPRELILSHHLNRSSIIILLENIMLHYKQALVNPGEMVGIIAAQSCGEPTTQMTLNTFHFAGVASKTNVTLGVPRIEEILSLSTTIKQPSDTIYLKEFEQHDLERAKTIINMIEHTRLVDIVYSASIIFEKNSRDSKLIKACMDIDSILDGCTTEMEKQYSTESKWVIRLVLDKEQMFNKKITMDDINFTLKQHYTREIECIYTDYNEDELIFRIQLMTKINKKNVYKDIDDMYKLKSMQEHILNSTILRGIKHIEKINFREVKNMLVKENGNIVIKNENDKQPKIYVLDTVGSNLIDILGLDYIDATKTYSNDIREMAHVLGIEAARESILNEFKYVISASGGSTINDHHLSLLCDRMTCNSKLIAISRHGINNDDIGPIAKASFEETPEMLLKAAMFAEFETARGVSCNVMLGQPGQYGTNAFDIMTDIDRLKHTEINTKQKENKFNIESSMCDGIEIKENLGSITSITENKEFSSMAYVLDL